MGLDHDEMGFTGPFEVFPREWVGPRGTGRKVAAVIGAGRRRNPHPVRCRYRVRDMEEGACPNPNLDLPIRRVEDLCHPERSAEGLDIGR